MLKRNLKRAFSSVSSAIAPKLWKMRAGNRLLVLMYHRVLPLDFSAARTEQPGMIVSPETLEMHLRVIGDYFEVVHLDDWIQNVTEGRAIPAQACAITFDDGWRDNFVYAYPILKTFGSRATIFLVSNFVDRPEEFWPNCVARLLGLVAAGASVDIFPGCLADRIADVLVAVQSRGSATPDLIDQAICTLKQIDEQEMHAALCECPEDVNAERNLLNRIEIAEMETDDLIRFGSHGSTHRRLHAGIGEQDLVTEVAESKRVLSEICRCKVNLFCYPNGDVSSRAVSMVRQNYIGAVTTANGWHSPGQDHFLVNRIGVHNDISDTRSAFITRIAGYL